MLSYRLYTNEAGDPADSARPVYTLVLFAVFNRSHPCRQGAIGLHPGRRFAAPSALSQHACFGQKVTEGKASEDQHQDEEDHQPDHDDKTGNLQALSQAFD